ncbi:MAG: hypothetical protein U5O16_20775 [Rhodococcus sp. (in: high G+C Gram-positive bacteria)]|uniref:hypothetical protein n=1 Tax=Rhodococcus sp. TaxID=1831 RepID=UPI002ADB7845|nr:hypothetical protein [Rhodococcus sp. (in: high G+C Gram-positive bacteria)]
MSSCATPAAASYAAARANDTSGIERPEGATVTARLVGVRTTTDLLAADVRAVGQAAAACGSQSGAATAFVGGGSDL